jgi:membrane dipeptidase
LGGRKGRPEDALSVVAGLILVLILLVDASAEGVPVTERIHREAIVVDGHNDVTSWILDFGYDLGMNGADPAKRNAALQWVVGGLLPRPSGDQLRTHTDLERLRAGGIDAQFFSIFAHPRYAKVPGGTKARALQMIDALEEQIRRHSEDLELAIRAEDVRRISRRGRIAVLMGLEGGHAIEDDLGNLREFRDRGVRYMTLTWANSNSWADSSSDDSVHGGLTEFGREVIREMNRLGIVVDVSHASDETFWHALETTRAPLMASHSSARALVPNPRNLSDEMLEAVSRNGGIVMVNFGGTFIDPRKATRWRIIKDLILHCGPSRVGLDLLLDHIDHVVRVAGIDHVGLGSDFDGTIFLPEGASDVSGFPNVTSGLLDRGYSEVDVRKVLGENVLRVLEEAETLAQ